MVPVRRKGPPACVALRSPAYHAPRRAVDPGCCPHITHQHHGLVRHRAGFHWEPLLQLRPNSPIRQERPVPQLATDSGSLGVRPSPGRATLFRCARSFRPPGSFSCGVDHLPAAAQCVRRHLPRPARYGRSRVRGTETPAWSKGSEPSLYAFGQRGQYDARLLIGSDQRTDASLRTEQARQMPGLLFGTLGRSAQGSCCVGLFGGTAPPMFCRMGSRSLLPPVYLATPSRFTSSGR